MTHDRHRPGAAGGRPESDATRSMPAAESDATRSMPAAESDATRSMPAAESDATRSMPAAEPDATRSMPAAESDATRSMPAADWAREADATAGAGPDGPDPTAPLPAERTAPEPVWSARAPVRPPGTASGAGGVAPEPVEWFDAAPERRGAWWMPILVGVVALLLLGLLGAGVWMIMEATADDRVPVVPASAPVATDPATEPTTTPPTGPTTTAPSPSAPEPSSAPGQPRDVRVPALVGLSSAEARQALDRVGLTYRLIHRPAEAPAGTVIDSDPPEGREVPADTRVTLVVAITGATEPSVDASPAGEADVPGD